MDENVSSKLVTVGNLSAFYNQIKGIFLSLTTADGRYAGKSGVTGTFTAGKVQLTNGATLLVEPYVADDVVYLKLTANNYSTLLPITGQARTYVTNDQLAAKAGAVTVTVDDSDLSFIAIPEITVLKSIVVTQISHTLFISTSGLVSGDAVFIQGYSNVSDGIYLVSCVNSVAGTVTASNLVYVGPASRYTEYYCAENDRHYIWNGIAMVAVDEPTTQIIDGDDTYETATDADIISILNE